MNSRYDDIIDLPRPVSNARRHMTNRERAAQFAPFAALSGYGDAVNEEARLTTERIELDEYEKLALDAEFKRISGGGDSVTLVYFLADAKKAGGSYVSVTGSVKRVDPVERLVILAGGTKIPMDDIISVSAS